MGDLRSGSRRENLLHFYPILPFLHAVLSQHFTIPLSPLRLSHASISSASRRLQCVWLRRLVLSTIISSAYTRYLQTLNGAATARTWKCIESRDKQSKGIKVVIRSGVSHIVSFQGTKQTDSIPFNFFLPSTTISFNRKGNYSFSDGGI